MPFQSLREILPQTLQALGLGDRLREAQVHRAWRDAVAAVAPDLPAGVPVRLDDGTLTIRVADPATAARFATVEKQLLQAIASSLRQTGVPAIERLHFRQ
jgi:hypothetical protein